MKQASNNEVDLLLRALARGRNQSSLGRGSNSGDGNRAISDHLDADELNSYAEGMVPAPARARYTEHLADCDVCRGIVVNLTQAAGIAVRSEVQEQKGGYSFWQKLATLLSPAVLRFAVPALVLTAVIGIGFLAMRQQRGREYVARNEQADSAPVKLQPSQAGSPAMPTFDSTSGDSTFRQKGVESSAASEPVKEEKYLEEDKKRVAQEAGSKSVAVETGALASKDSPQPAEGANRLEMRPGYAPEPKPGAPTPAASTVTVTDADKTAKLAKEQPEKLDDQERQQRDQFKNTPSDEHGPNRSRAPSTAGAQATNRRLDGLAAGRGGPYGQQKKGKIGERANEKAEAEVDTRTVSGRRFVHDGKAWVDTAFDPSRTPIRVARGSEQFRALVADEPGLRAITEQLAGVVIVVWKNRAYRIQ